MAEAPVIESVAGKAIPLSMCLVATKKLEIIRVTRDAFSGAPRASPERELGPRGERGEPSPCLEDLTMSGVLDSSADIEWGSPHP